MKEGLANDAFERPLARIISTGSYVPAQVLTNQEISTGLDTTDEWIVERTGIRERRVAAPDELASDMAVEASRRALQESGLDPKSLAQIVVATISADQPLPSCAVHVQRKLGATCPAYDVSAACAGFLFGLDIASRYIETGSGPILVVGVELLSRLLDWDDRQTCVLFGDGAGAVILNRSDSSGHGVLHTVLGAKGEAAQLLHIPADEGVVRMRGREVFRLAVTELGSACRGVLDKAGLTADDVDHAVMHQANRRILASLSRRLGIPWERFHLTIEKFGNTSSASIPIGLDDARRKGKIATGQVVLMAALGAGAAWGASVVRF